MFDDEYESESFDEGEVFANTLVGICQGWRKAMPSPFPGMDPYLEAHWGDVHSSLVIYARNELQKVLPGDLRARVEQRVVVTGLSRPRSLYPDVRVIETQRKSHRPASGLTGNAIAEPVVIELPDEAETQTFVEIRQVSPEARLVTVLEVLSPSNKKAGDAQEQYLRKQLEFLQAGITLVEIDLLREGEWVVALPQKFYWPRPQTLCGRTTGARVRRSICRNQIPATTNTGWIGECTLGSTPVQPASAT